MADHKVSLTKNIAKISMSVGHDVDSIPSDTSNNQDFEHGNPQVPLAWQMNSFFIDFVITCLVL